MKFKLSKEFVKKYPDAVEYFVVAHGVNNEIASKWISDELKSITEKIRDQGKDVLDSPKYKLWDKTYEKLAKDAGLKAKDFIPSHTNLIKRILSGKDVPNISPIINFINLYQLKYETPIGGEDLSALYGDIEFKISKGGERFRLFGETEVETVKPGEVITEDDHSVTCRMWGWHPSDRTKVTKKTQDLYVTFDGLKGIKDVDLDSVTEEFAKILEEKFGATAEVIRLDADNLEGEIQYSTKKIDESIFTDKIVIGKILKLEKIPETKGSLKARINLGSKGKVQVVCGGTNLKEGDMVAVALPGSKVISKEGGMKEIERSEVHGVQSDGMVCGPLELGVGNDYWFYWVLSPDLEKYLGDPLGDHLDEIELPFDWDHTLEKETGKGKKVAKKNFMKRKALSMGLVDSKQFIPKVGAVVDKKLKELGYKQSAEVGVSQNKQFGDLSSAMALRLAKELKQPPPKIAEEMVEGLKEDSEISEIFNEISVAPNGFINFRVSPEYLMSELEEALNQGADYGSSDVGDNKVILVEGPSINPNAAAHAGHLMNIFICRTLVRLFNRVGFKAEIDNLINDRGIKICMAMWGVENLPKIKDPEEAGMKPDQFLGKYYAETKKKYKEDPEVKAEIDQMLIDWEAGKPEVMKLWKKVINWAFTGHKNTLERLGEEVGHLWLESEIYTKGRDIIEKYLGKGLIEKLPDRAVTGRLEETYGVPDVILLRSDGTSLYHTQDIYLTLQKIKKFSPWKAIWVVGNEQILHFQQLFALLDGLGILSADNLYHFAYGLVVDKNGQKLGKGLDDVSADGLLNIMHEDALKVIENRKISVELRDEDEVAEAVGIGAIRYSFLSGDPYKNITFDPDEALSFTGKSGPYIMYAYSRGRNVLRNAINGDIDNYRVSVGGMDKSDSNAMTNIDKELILTLLNYPETVLNAANNYAPSILAEYLYDVASKFSNFYEKETVSGAKGAEKELRIAITQLTTRVLKDGLGLLGINVLEKM